MYAKHVMSEVVADTHVQEASAGVVHKRIFELKIQFELSGHIDVEPATEIKTSASGMSSTLIFPVVESHAGERIDVEASGQGKRELHVDACYKGRFTLVAKYVSKLRCDPKVRSKRVLEI